MWKFHYLDVLFLIGIWREFKIKDLSEYHIITCKFGITLEGENNYVVFGLWWYQIMHILKKNHQIDMILVTSLKHLTKKKEQIWEVFFWKFFTLHRQTNFEREKILKCFLRFGRLVRWSMDDLFRYGLLRLVIFWKNDLLHKAWFFFWKKNC